VNASTTETLIFRARGQKGSAGKVALVIDLSELEQELEERITNGDNDGAEQHE
jgi:hypothetical protein